MDVKLIEIRKYNTFIVGLVGCNKCGDWFIKRGKDALSIYDRIICPICEGRGGDLELACDAVKAHEQYHIKSAAKRELGYTIPIGLFVGLVLSDCFYCGSRPLRQVSSNRTKFKVNGIDRIDSSLGYHISNIVPCCKFCNMAKGRHHVEEFMIWMNSIRHIS